MSLPIEYEYEFDALDTGDQREVPKKPFLVNPLNF
jgi:hypothetical protein